MKKIPIGHTPAASIPKYSTILLYIDLLIVILWHTPHIPVLTLIYAGLLAFLSCYSIVKKKPFHKWLRFLLTVAAVIFLYLEYSFFLGRDVGVSALVLMVFLKLMEVRSTRDYQIVLYVVYFMAMSAALYEQGILELLFIIFVFFVTTLILQEIHGQRWSWMFFRKALLGMSTHYLLLSPFVLVFFVFFPRSSQPLLQLGVNQYRFGRSGFSDVVRPGSVSRMALSTDPAFQVRFPEGRIPRGSELYFRGAVLWATDGLNWFRGSRWGFPVGEQIDTGEFNQEIILYPHGKRWLFALDRPVRLPSWAERTGGDSFASPIPVNRLTRYSVRSTLISRPYSPLASHVRKWATQLPRLMNPQMLNLAQQWRAQAKNDWSVVQFALDYFVEKGFVYTLEPDLLDSLDPISDFIFRARRGFCEHFASAFGLLLRSAGVPVRLVAGYQGGVLDEKKHFLLVRQSESHVWNEVWIENRGWVRVDPTAVVAPDRIRNHELYQYEESDPDSALSGDRILSRNGPLGRWLGGLWRKIKSIYDSLEYAWTYWFITFSRPQQNEMIRNLAGEKRGEFDFILLSITFFGVSVLFIVILIVFRKNQNKIKKEVFAYQHFCRKMEKYGLKRGFNEGPERFLQRAKLFFPENSADMKKVTSLYIEIHYGRGPASTSALRELKKVVRSFRPEFQKPEKKESE